MNEAVGRSGALLFVAEGVSSAMGRVNIFLRARNTIPVIIQQTITLETLLSLWGVHPTDTRDQRWAIGPHGYGELRRPGSSFMGGLVRVVPFTDIALLDFKLGD